ncbi:MAG: putative DNA binding domain-containing protein [Planctomycetes bacterium]|nr:putative DNA binding domain-containing protein [Planctomycetota bacterium]
MTDDELEILLSDLESDRTERKASVADPGKIRQAICAFANDMPNHNEPGVLYIGVHDDGNCASLDISDQLLTQLASMRDDGNILPMPSLTVQSKTLNGCAMTVVVVHPSQYPPVRYNGRVWIRVGPRRATASADEERQLNEKRRAKDLPFDLRPISSATVSDLIIELFEQAYLSSAVARDVLDENQRTIDQQLASLRFTSVDPPITPTVVGLLTIGKTPADYIPGAYIQFLRIDGITLADPIADQRECHGPLPDLLSQLDGILKANIHIATDIQSSSTEQQSPDYPISAIQQLIRNAVMHRNYETSNAPVQLTWFRDRIEIQNPGGPFGRVTCQNFGTPGRTDYRNPNVAEAMRTLGFVQRFGVGLQIARQALEDNGNPPPKFDVEENNVLVTVRTNL